jgi:serine/threonine protein kinase/Tol biopolymer transport system component
LGFKLKDIEVIYHAALEKQAGPERTAYLDSVCGGNGALRDHVEALLKADKEAGDFLEALVLDDTATWGGAVTIECPGTVIDRYTLLEGIGAGGMAVVYMAEQKEPIRRRVALKIIKLGMDTKQVIARFEAERQALALMDHPNIAKVFDAGATETGRPYFVMELVRGVSITDYCDANSLSTKERLELFIQVCNAVQHAHQKGIIHRDIKPSNVMVTLHDGVPVPKVIDFGIAKATNSRLTEKTVFTRYAQMIGTPAYMSPEQAQMSGLDVDTRTDIYSLGVLLYELLTGTTPFATETLMEAGYAEMQRIIRETDPLKPSTRIRTLGQTLTDVARSRQASPEVLPKLVRGDLDRIVMKTLEKDRTRRYETAHALAEDIERHLRHEPILAGSPGTIYRVRKFVRRHRLQVITFSAVVILVVGLSLAAFSYVRFAVQRTRGEHQKTIALVEDLLSRGRYEQALSEVSPVLSSRFVGPKARLLRARMLVELQGPSAGIEALQDLLDEPPEIAANAHFLLARVYLEAAPDNSEAKRRADSHLRRGERLLPRTAEAYLLRAITARTMQATLAWLDDALELDPGHYDARRARALAYDALGRYRDMETEASVMIGSQPMNPAGYSLRAIARREIALTQNDKSQLAAAVTDHDRAVSLCAAHDKRFAELCSQRCDTLMQMGRYKQALADAQTCVRLRRLEPMHHFRLFCILTALGDYQTAQAEYDSILNSRLMDQKWFDCSAAKYVFDSLWAGRPWHPQGIRPPGSAFGGMHRATEQYHQLAARGRRIVCEGFHPNFSPDGTELAYSRGVLGASGVEILNLGTGQRRLLTVPGKDPAWSADGQYIVYVRDRQVVLLDNLTSERQGAHPPMELEEIWITRADGTGNPRFVAKGGWPDWSRSSNRIFYHSRLQSMIYSVNPDPNNTQPREILASKDPFAVVSPDEKYAAFMPDAVTFQIVDLANKSVTARWSAPDPNGQQLFLSWSPDGRRLSIGCYGRGGLWMYDVDKKEAFQVFDGAFSRCSWSPVDSSRVAVEKVYGQWHLEIWLTDLN